MAIDWGPAYANTLWVPYFDNATSWGEPAEDHETLRMPSGYRTAWLPSEVQKLAGDVAWIPTVDTLDPYATGWDGTTGWRAALAWMRVHEENRPRVRVDDRNRYRLPTLSVDSNADGIADGHVIFRSLPATAYAMEGGAQKITASFTGANQLAGIQATYQPPAWVGMPATAYSVSAKVTRAGATTGNLQLVMRREFRSAANTMLSFSYLVLATDPNASDFVRYTVLDSALPPAGTASVALYPALRSMVDASATGSVALLSNVQAEWGAFSTFVNSDVYIESYLVEPLKGEPLPESDGTRRIRVQFESYTGATYDGY